MDYQASLEETINESFTQYAGAVIQSRALVDVRDCVKPSARQIYYCLYTDGFTADKPFKKTLKAIGSAMRMYIHGDASCEGIIMRSGQPFSMRYPLIEVEGSYGNLTETGNWAASRYTSARLSPLANYLLQDTSHATVDEWVDNYDDTEQYPRVLSSLGFYNIVNGSFGIAVGLASSIPQFNLKEVNNALIKLLKADNPESVKDTDILCFPDFATGGTIINKDDVLTSLSKGTGKPCIIQSTIEYDAKEHCLIVTELPYGVYTNTICTELEKLSQKEDNFPIVRINDLTGEKVCIKLYLSKTADAQKTIQYLYNNTSLQSSYSINLTMLKNGRQPHVYSWKEALIEHLSHEKVTYIKEYQQTLKELRHKLKITEGIIAAIQHINQVVKAIKNANSAKAANLALQTLLSIDEEQAKAILDMKLVRLTKLEIDEFQARKEKLTQEIEDIEAILSNETLLKDKMIERFNYVSKHFGDERRTKITQQDIPSIKTKTKQNKIAEPVVVCYTENGYIKAIPTAKYRAVEGNIGRIETTTDGYIQVYNTSKVYRLKVDNIKQCLASEKGTPLGSLLGTGLTHINMVVACGEDKDIIAVSKNGRVKKFNTSIFDGTVQNIKGQDYFPKSEVTQIFDIGKYITFITEQGKSMSVDISQLKACGKTSTGRIGIKLDVDDFVSYAKASEVPLSTLKSLGTKGK